MTLSRFLRHHSAMCSMMTLTVSASSFGYVLNDDSHGFCVIIRLCAQWWFSHGFCVIIQLCAQWWLSRFLHHHSAMCSMMTLSRFLRHHSAMCSMMTLTVSASSFGYVLNDDSHGFCVIIRLCAQWWFSHGFCVIIQLCAQWWLSRFLRQYSAMCSMMTLSRFLRHHSAMSSIITFSRFLRHYSARCSMMTLSRFLRHHSAMCSMMTLSRFCIGYCHRFTGKKLSILYYYWFTNKKKEAYYYLSDLLRTRAKFGDATFRTLGYVHGLQTLICMYIHTHLHTLTYYYYFDRKCSGLLLPHLALYRPIIAIRTSAAESAFPLRLVWNTFSSERNILIKHLSSTVWRKPFW